MRDPGGRPCQSNAQDGGGQRKSQQEDKMQEQKYIWGQAEQFRFKLVELEKPTDDPLIYHVSLVLIH